LQLLCIVPGVGAARAGSNSPGSERGQIMRNGCVEFRKQCGELAGMYGQCRYWMLDGGCRKSVRGLKGNVAGAQSVRAVEVERGTGDGYCLGCGRRVACAGDEYCAQCEYEARGYGWQEAACLY